MYKGQKETEEFLKELEALLTKYRVRLWSYDDIYVSVEKEDTHTEIDAYYDKGELERITFHRVTKDKGT